MGIMKKILLVISIILLATNTKAQQIKTYGVKVGITSSSHNWDFSNSVISSDKRIGINIGFFAEIYDISYFSLIGEVKYFQKGFKIEIEKTTLEKPDGIGEYFTWDKRFDYINMTVLGKLRLDMDAISPYFLFGPKIDYEINQNDSSNFDDFDYKNTIFGLNVGVGTEFVFSSFRLLIEILYELDSNYLLNTDNVKVYGNSFDLRLGVAL